MTEEEFQKKYKEVHEYALGIESPMPDDEYARWLTEKRREHLKKEIMRCACPSCDESCC